MAMKRALIVILPSGFLALLTGIWLFGDLGRPTRNTIILDRPVPAASLRTSKNFALHPEPRALPRLAFATGDGKVISLDHFRGKAVLLNIWATWCVPCRTEMPTLDRLQKMLGGPAFEVVALSIDRAGPGVVRDFYREVGIKNLALYIDSTNKVTPMLGIVGIPTTVLIDPQGREIGRLIGPADWDTPDMVAFLKKRLSVLSGPAARERPR